MISHKVKAITLFLNFLLIIIGIFYPLGEPISPHLRRYGPFAVDDHNFTGRALHLRQSRLVNNSG